MALYLDDDSVNTALIRNLTDDDHDVVTPRAAGTAGHTDPLQFMLAIRMGRVLFTNDHQDLTVLNDLILLAGGHPGILVVRRDNDSNRDMSTRTIVRAIRNLIASGIAIPMQSTSSTIGAESESLHPHVCNTGLSPLADRCR